MRFFAGTVGCLLVGLASAGVAQEYRASIAGEVTDPSRAAVEGAKVTASSVERGVNFESTTNSSGRYNISFLLPGRYTIMVEKRGFRTIVREGLSLLAADKLPIDFKLELGAAADSVTVSTEASLLRGPAECGWCDPRRRAPSTWLAW
jgi:hypothetical protein